MRHLAIGLSVAAVSASGCGGGGTSEPEGGSSANGESPSGGTPDLLPDINEKALRLNLSTPGRVGFYIDYSERSTVGTHKFYVCRTHGTVGAVSVDYSTSGDAHAPVSGTLQWGHGEADIKSFTVDVTAKSAGEHRIVAQLLNPSGGAVLHFGEYTRAYGVIDDGTVAGDAEAVFFDMAAASNGSGTSASPYDNIYDAIANVGAKRYIYGRGTVTPDGTDTVTTGAVTIRVIRVPAGRTEEASRLYIRNWPGFTLTVDGGGATAVGGFYAQSGESFHTYRGIDFRNLDTSSTTSENGAVRYRYGGSAGINVELCTADNIDAGAGANNSAYALWGVNGAKIWRCTASNITIAGNLNHNGAGVQTYDGKNMSVQRCEFSQTLIGVYQKRLVALGDVSISVRFSLFDGCYVEYGISGSSGAAHSYTIVQGNVFKNIVDTGAILHLTSNAAAIGEKQWWCCNVFDTCGRGENAPVYFRLGNTPAIFNNIFTNCRGVWREIVDVSGSAIEYADYNHVHNISGVHYEVRAVDYADRAALVAAYPTLGQNDSSGDPLFTDANALDYTLEPGSPCIGAGVEGTDQGVHLTGVEVVGP